MTETVGVACARGNGPPRVLRAFVMKLRSCSSQIMVNATAHNPAGCGFLHSGRERQQTDSGASNWSRPETCGG
ncbi:hypothetical protein SKAU_G00231930 [Synaphobranchus kaupii]|uniref:Uncharacterized protein n=1 Tax=Synaphobranchus kaupii TaxID=118154 RepID=A0A9Q1IT24_SYNKA|nr:hypothetical protein SKAU_G00231930 [Synaphobranchus kaupii]